MQTEINKEAAHTDARGGCRGTLAFDILRIRDPSTVRREVNKLSIQRIRASEEVGLCMQWHFLNDWPRNSKKNHTNRCEMPDFEDFPSSSRVSRIIGTGENE